MSTVKKPALPDTPRPGQDRFQFDSRVKETLEVLTGVRAGKVSQLESGATNAEIISKLNELISRLM